MTDRENTSTSYTTPTGETSLTPITGCRHLRFTDCYRQMNCLDWGIYLPRVHPDLGVYTLREDSSYKFFAEVPLDDVLDQMKTIMHVNRVYKPQPNYIKYRRFLVDWMWEIGDINISHQQSDRYSKSCSMGLSFTTIHHSVALMDTFFSKVQDIETNKAGKEFLQLVALTSIFISAKFWEKDSRGPTAANISTLTRGQYSEKQILDCERFMLLTIDWQLHFATPADFLVLFLNQGIIYSDDLVWPAKGSSVTNHPTLKVVQYVRRYAEFFVDLCLQEYEFQKFDSHTLAWAIVLASRRAVRMKRTWNDEFEYLLDCQKKDVEACYREIYKFYLASFPSKNECSKPKESLEVKCKQQKQSSSTTRQQATTLQNRSNSIKSHLWKIETKNITNIKPRTHINKNNRKASINQVSGERNSLTRMGSTKGCVTKTIRDNSLNGNITTPDKPLPTSMYKNSSSNKKSSIKRYKPSEIKQCRIPRPALYDLNNQRPKIQSRNSKMDVKRPTKLDFGSHNSSLKISSSTRSKKVLCPSNSSYKQFSKLPVSSGTLGKENIPKSDLRQGFKPKIKSNSRLGTEINKWKIYTTIDSKPSLSRNQTLLKCNSRTQSSQRMNEWLKNYRSMSTIRRATKQTTVAHNTSMNKPTHTGVGLNMGHITHNRSYGRIYPESIRQ